MRNAKFIRNLAQISFRSDLVLHHRCATDDVQVRDFCQVIQDFVLHAIREKRALRIGLQTTSDDCLQIAVERRSKRTQAWRRSRSSLMNDNKHIRAHERWPASQQIK